MPNFKVVMLLEDCSSASEARMWAREAPGEILKVTKVKGPYGKRGIYDILLDGMVHIGTFRSKSKALAMLKLTQKDIQSKGINGVATLAER